MRLKLVPGGYKMWLSANDTYNWAHKAGACWPCSELSGKRLFVEYDSNGLCDIAIDGNSQADCSAHELDAIVADFTRGKILGGHLFIVE